MGDEIILPSAERVARPLTRLIEDVPRLLEVWTRAVEKLEMYARRPALAPHDLVDG